MKDTEKDLEQPSFAVYILDGCDFVPVSFGDSEWECQAWIKDHQDFFNGQKPYIGRIMDTIIFP